MPLIIKRVFLSLLLLCTVSLLQSQVKITGSTGADGTYTSLKSAFDKLNSNVNQANKDIVITITASTYEKSTASLVGQTKSWNSLVIYPMLSGLSITGNFSAPLIELNGAKNVCIDGRVNATGSTKNLTITNTSISNANGTSTIRFVNDASFNRIQYCSIQGAEACLVSGIIFFSITTGKNGNDNNTIDTNDITSSSTAQRPINAVYSSGSVSKVNDHLTISNNNIYDFLNPAVASNGVALTLNTTDCTITNNSFYERSCFEPTKAVNYALVRIDAPNGSGFTISGNYMGGQDAWCAGSAWLKASTQNNAFDAIYLNTNVARVNSIQQNTIKNFAWSNAGNAPWSAISIVSGVANVGNEIGNTIGDPTGVITVTGASNAQAFYGIQLSSSYAINCQNNVIESIVVSNAPSNAANFFGIYKSSGTGSTIISNNRIGNTSLKNSIIAASNSLDNEQSVYGIYSQGTGIVTINNNIIANLTNETNSLNTNTKGVLNGITIVAGKNTITNNIISHLTIGNANDACDQYASVVGIVHSFTTLLGIVTGNTIHDLCNTEASFTGNVYGVFFSGGAMNNAISDNLIYNLSALATSSATLTGVSIDTPLNTSTVSKNTIYNLSLPHTSADAVSSIIGLSFSAGTGGFNTVTKNFIHSFSTNTNATAGLLYGIDIKAGASVFSNNIIVMDGSSNSTITGIRDTSPVAHTSTLFHNTVCLNGSRKAGNNPTYALYSASDANKRNYQNNIFLNAHTNDGATGKHFAVYLAYALNTSLTINNNDYYAPGAGGVLGYHTEGDHHPAHEITTLTEWQVRTGQDENSKNSQPTFVNEGGIHPTDYQQVDLLLTATETTPITYDFGDTPRSSKPLMGAWEYVLNCWKGMLSSDWKDAENWTQKIVLTAGADLVFDDNALNDCCMDQNRHVNAIINPTNRCLNINQHQLMLKGAIVQSASGRVDASSPNSTIVYTGTSLQSIEANQFVNEKISILKVENSVGLKLNTSLEVGNMHIAALASIIIPEQTQLTVTGITTNNAGVSGIVIHSSDSGTGSLHHTTDQVSATVNRYIGSADAWKFVSSPVKEQSISGNWTPSGTYTHDVGYDLLVYDEPSACWISDQNATVAPTWLVVHPQINLVPGKGYLYALQDANQTKMFTGSLNNGVVTVPLTANASEVTKKGFNLVGNPYASSIDWTANAGFMRSMLEVRGGGFDMWIWNASANNYGVYNSAADDDMGTNDVSRYIAPMQAFFVKATGNGPLSFNNAARTNKGADHWLKSPAARTKDYVTFTLASDGFGSDEVQLCVGNKQKQQGSLKLFSPVNTAPSLYVPFENEFYSVHYLTDAVANKPVQLGFKAGAPGEYTLQCLIDGSTVQEVYLVDKETHLTHSFASSSIYSFKSNNTSMSNRFEIYVDSKHPSTDWMIPKVYVVADKLQVDLSALSGDYLLRLNDMTGRTLAVLPIEGGESVSLPLASHGVYIATIVSPSHRRVDFKVMY